MMGTLMMVTGGMGLVILIVAAGIARLFVQASASVRHLVWTLALGLLIAVPIIEASGIRLEVPVSGPLAAIADGHTPVTTRTPVEKGTAATNGSTAAASPVAIAAASSETSGDSPDEARGWPNRDPVPLPVPGRADEEQPLVSADERSPAAGGSGVDVKAPRTPPNSGVASPLPPGTTTGARSWWVGAVALVWSLGAIGLLLATVSSHFAAFRLVTTSVHRASPTVSRRFAIVAADLGIRPMPRLVISSRVSVPATWGLRRATVVLPEGYEEWSAATVDRVILHELAHVYRGDCTTYLTGEVARALHWPNPLAWLALHRQRVESERACDDLVLRWGMAPSDYADDLLRLMRVFTPGGSLPAAAMAMARPSSGLPQRVRAVLDPKQSRREVDRGSARAATALAWCLAVAVMCVTPVVAESETDGTTAAGGAPAQLYPTPPSAPEPRRPGAVPVPAVPGPPASPSVPEPHSVPEPNATSEVSGVGVPEPTSVPDPVRPPAPTWGVGHGAPREDRPGNQELQEHCVFDADGRRSTSVSSDDNVVRIRWETTACSVAVDIEGDIEYAADDSRVIAMARGARFEIEERIGRDEVRVRLVGTTGEIERRYWVNGDEAAWDAGADAWMARLLPELFRHTTINAEPRVRRLLAEGGSDRVFAEVERAHSEHVKSTYLELLIEAADLREADYIRIIDFAGGMESDHSSGELLLTVVDRAGLLPAFQDPLLRAAEGLESDHQKSRVLEVILRSELSPAQVDAVLRSAMSIESDHNLGVVLSSVARTRQLSEIGRSAFLDALSTIESDHNHGIVVSAFLDVGPLSPEEVSRVLEMTEGIGSDHERGTLLRRIGSEYALTGDQLTAYLVSASAIASDHELGMTAQALTVRRALSREQLDLVLGIARRISSDHQRASALQTILLQQDLSNDAVTTFFDVASGIGSDHQLAETLRLFTENVSVSASQVTELLDVTGTIGSSHQRAIVLMAIAERYPLDDVTRPHFERLTEGLSRADRERTVAAIRR